MRGRPLALPLSIVGLAAAALPTAATTQVVPKGFTADAALDAGLKVPIDARVYRWTAGQSEPILPPAGGFMCVLTGLSGNFAGGGEHIVLGIEADAKDARWTLMGTSGQAQLSAAVTCVPKNRFTPAMLDASSITQGPAPYLVSTSCNVRRTATTYPLATTALFLRELAGAWRGGGEQVRLAGSSMQVGGCSGHAGASMGAIGFPGPVQYLSNVGRGPLSAAATMTMTVSEPNNTGAAADLFSASASGRALVPYDRALCGFVGLAGKLQGYGESVSLEARMVSGIRMWWLDIKSAAKPSYLSASVRCIARDQRPA